MFLNETSILIIIMILENEFYEKVKARRGDTKTKALDEEQIACYLHRQQLRTKLLYDLLYWRDTSISRKNLDDYEKNVQVMFRHRYVHP